MENNKFWIYLSLGVVAALSIKWFNAPLSTDSVASKRWSIGATMTDDIQYKRSTRDHTRVAGLSERRTTPVITHVKSGATTAAPAVAAKKDVKLKNVAKKKDAKKKKKKKKKPRIMGVPEETLTESDDEVIEAKAVPTSGAPAPLAFERTAAPATAAPAASTLAEWERILLVSANHRETTRFIGLYQTRQITAEVFYGIVGQMINDGRTQMRQLGIMSLAATPSLESYELLVAANESETGPLKAEAARLIDQTYNRPQAINIIYAALTREVSLATQLQALNNLSALIANLRAPSSQPLELNDQPSEQLTEQTVTPSKTDLVTQQRVLEYFKRLHRDAMPKLLQSKDPRVQALAQTVSGQLTVALNSATQPIQAVSQNGL